MPREHAPISVPKAVLGLSFRSLPCGLEQSAQSPVGNHVMDLLRDCAYSA